MALTKAASGLTGDNIGGDFNMKVLASYYISNIAVLNINSIEYGTNDKIVLSLCTSDKIVKAGITRQVYYTRKGAYINVFKRRLYLHEFIKAGL